MNNEVLQVLKETKIAFETNNQLDFFICIHILRKYNIEVSESDDAVDYIQSNRPSKVLFPEIYNHEAFIRIASFTAFWNDRSTNDETTGIIKSLNNSAYMKDVVFPQKVKYLELLIAKLQSGFNIGDVVKKKSNKPFKNGEHTDTIIGFTSNSNHPNNKIAAILKDSDTIVCLNSLKLGNNSI